MLKKRLHEKDKVNFKIHDVTAWLTNNCNTNIAQSLANYRQADNETWSFNKIYQQKYFSLKIMLEIMQGD